MTIIAPRMTEAEFMCLPDDGRKYELVDEAVKEVSGSVRNAEIAAICQSVGFLHESLPLLNIQAKG